MKHPAAPPVPPLLLRQVWTLCWLGGILASRWFWPSITALALLPLVDRRLHTLPRLGIFGLCILAGWGSSILSQPSLPERPTVSGTPLLEGRVRQVQGLPEKRLRIFLEQVRITESSSAAASPSAAGSLPRLLPGLTVWSWDDPSFRPLPGQYIRIRSRLRDIQGNANPGMTDTGDYWLSLGVFQRIWSKGDKGMPDVRGTPYTTARWREHLRSRLNAALGHGEELTQAQAFLPALLFGDRSALSLQTMERMTQAALIHSLALSGQHLGLAISCAALLAWLCIRLWPASFLYVPRQRLVPLLSLPPALLYLWLGDAPPSLLRAFFMLCFFALCFWRKQSRTLLDPLLDAVLVLTLTFPRLVFDVGFQLSVLSVATIALAAPILHACRPSPPGQRTFWRRLFIAGGELTALSALLTITLLPVTLLTFHSASPWFFFNLLWLPVLACGVLPLAAGGLACLAGGLDGLAHCLLQLATLPCQMLLDLLAFCDAAGMFHLPLLPRPHWTVFPGMAALFAGLALWPGRSTLPASGKKLLFCGSILLLTGILLFFQPQFSRQIRLSLLDVGQGLAVVLDLPGAERLLLDGGGSLSTRFDTGRHIVAPVLCQNHFPRLTHVINSHPHLDHLRGLLFILEQFQVGTYWHNGELPPGDDGRRLSALLQQLPSRILRAGDSIPLTMDPALRLEVLWPPDGTAHGNNASLCLRLVWNDRGLALLPGDMEREALKRLVHSGRDLRADILVAPHHGSSDSLLPDLYDTVSPSLVLVSCGHDTRYNMPSPKLVRLLRQRHIPLYTTAASGCISIQWDTDKPDSAFTISTMR